MAEVGMVKPLIPPKGLLRLNIGGLRVHVGHSVLQAQGGKGPYSSRLSDLLEYVWDNRLPRDKGNYLVIDESPACVKHLIHKLIKRSGTAMGMPGLSLGEDLPLDQKPFMAHIARVVGLVSG